MAKTDWWMKSGSLDSDMRRYPTSKWDLVNIGGMLLPGIVDVEGDGGNRLDVKHPKGRSSARLEFSGYKPFDITITLLIAHEKDWKQVCEELLPMIRPKNTIKIPEPLEVIHPVFRAYGIRSIVIKDISFPKSEGKGAGKQIKTITIKAWEFIPIEWKKEESTGEKDNVLTGKTTPAPNIPAQEANFASDRRPPSETGYPLTGAKGGYPGLIDRSGKKKKKDGKTQVPLIVDKQDPFYDAPSSSEIDNPPVGF